MEAQRLLQASWIWGVHPGVFLSSRILLLPTIAQQTSLKKKNQWLISCVTFPQCSLLVEKWALDLFCVVKSVPINCWRLSIWIKTKLEKFAMPICQADGEGFLGERRARVSTLWNSVLLWEHVLHQGFLLAPSGAYLESGGFLVGFKHRLKKRS